MNYRQFYILIILFIILFVNGLAYGADTTKTKIDLADLKRLGLEINFLISDSSDYSDFKITEINSIKIIKPKVLYERNDKYKEQVKSEGYRSQNQHLIFINGDDENTTAELNKNNILMLMGDMNGFESIAYVLTIWEKTGNNYRFKCVIDKGIRVSIGSAKFTEVTQHTDDSYGISGTTAGGDAGEVWSSFWSGLLIYPYNPSKFEDPQNRPYRSDFWKCVSEGHEGK